MALLFAIPFFNSCKKGDDDPFFSIHTRKARLVGEWKMTQGKIVQSYTGYGSGISTITFNNGTYTVTRGGDSYSGTYIFDVTIEKTGAFTQTISTTVSGSTDVITEEGTWFFLSKNKEADLKNKEAVAFQTNKTTESYDGQTLVTTETGGELVVYIITQLKNKEILMKRDYSYNETTNNETESEEYTLTLK